MVNTYNIYSAMYYVKNMNVVKHRLAASHEVISERCPKSFTSSNYDYGQSYPRTTPSNPYSLKTLIKLGAVVPSHILSHSKPIHPITRVTMTDGTTEVLDGEYSATYVCSKFRNRNVKSFQVMWNETRQVEDRVFYKWNDAFDFDKFVTEKLIKGAKEFQEISLKFD